MPKPPETRDIATLRRIMADLRNPDGGCPWDVEQSFETIAPYTIEEAYEVADAIERGAHGELRDELGDLLLQVVYHAQMASEAGTFTFDDVVAAICEKMIRRHPHVYGEAAAEGRATLAKGFWEDMKARERGEGDAGVLDGVARALPALMRAAKLQKRAAGVGFDWPDHRPVIAKVREELAELEEAIESGEPDEAAGEVGDLLFACANLARHLGVDPEAALALTNAKFVRRFGHVEARLAEAGRPAGDASLEEMDRYWNEAKALERS